MLIGSCGGTSSEPVDPRNVILALQVTDFGPVTGTVRPAGAVGTYSFTVTKLPTRGTLTLDSATGDFEYLPTEYAAGTDNFIVDIRDPQGGVKSGEVDISQSAGIAERPANSSCLAPDRPASQSTVRAVRVFAGIGQFDLISIYQPPAAPDTWWAILKQGKVIRFENRDNVSTYTTVLDLTGRVYSETESGLIGLVFHPSFQQNGKVYLYWTGFGAPVISYLSEFTSNDGGLTLDPTSERVLISLDHTTARHKGGHMEFGPDGYLYLGLGDGGPWDQAQDTSNIFGSLIRIDVDGGVVPYGIPPANPFVGGGGTPEIYAWGLRNPWRWSFDSATGDIWVGDVGRQSWEEIDIVQKGGNYGWPIREGAHCHPPEIVSCNTVGLIDPVFEYPHTGGSTAIIGGHVYHGELLDDLKGKYIFSDIGQLVSVLEGEPDGTFTSRVIVDFGGSNRGIWGISKDLNNELYIVKPDQIYRLEPETQVPAPVDFPELLSETGCFDPAEPTQPVSSMIPYDINLTFWSNGAVKQRWMAVPDGETIHINTEGDWDFPIGSVLAKQFYFNDTPVETRLLVRHDDGGWAGYAYQWRDDQSDADLLDGAVSLADQGISHTIPSRTQCMQCHVWAAGNSLGPENSQMNLFVDYPASGKRANQLVTLQSIGLFDTPLSDDPIDVPRLPATDDLSTDLVTRAKAYFHVNCSNCHRPGGPGRGTADFRFEVPHSDMGVCNMPAQFDDFGNPMVALIVPGDPSLSAVNIRVSQIGVAAMPPLGKQALDNTGIALLNDYVTSMTECP